MVCYLLDCVLRIKLPMFFLYGMDQEMQMMELAAISYLIHGLLGSHELMNHQTLNHL